MSTTRGALRRTASSKSNVSVEETNPAIPLRMSRRQATSSNSINNRNQSRLSSSNFLSQYSQLHDDKDKNLRMYFVLPEGKTRATCDSKLAIVYALCEDNNLDADWINEADCLKLKPMEGNIFVLSPFEGPAFEYLEKCRENVNIEIIGPQCINYGISRKKEPIVSIQTQLKISTITVAMRGVMVCLSGLNKKEKALLKFKIQRMGGHLSETLTGGVTHVVAKKVISPKCEGAFASKRPVMKPDWVEQVWIDSQEDIVHATDEKYRTFFCPVFYNLSICVSQFSMSLKESYKKIIEEHGGIYTGDLAKAVTSVLIVPNGKSQKFEAAQRWKIPCVIPDWVDDSKSAGHVLPFKEYMVKVEKGDADKSDDDKNDVEKGDAEVKKISTPQNSMVQPPPENGIAKGAGLNDSVISCVNGTRRNFTEASQMHDVSGLTFVAEAVDMNALDIAASKGIPYLDGCAIYVSGNYQLEKVKKHINAAGAIHLSTLRKNVTHVLATENKISTADLEKIDQLNKKPYLVNLKWLVASAKKGSPEDEELFAVGNNETTDVIYETILSTKSRSSSSSSRSNNASLGSKRNSLEAIVQPQQGNQLNHSNENCVNDDLDQDIQILEQVAEVQSIEPEGDLDRNELNRRSNLTNRELQADAANLTNAGSSGTADTGDDQDGSEAVYVFADCKIKIALTDEKELDEVTSAIEAAEGEIVTGSEFDFIVLPVVYDPELFPSLNETKRVTRFWVTDSIDFQTLIPLNNRKYYHRPVQAFNNMNTLMTDVVIAVTQYSNKEKNYLANLAEAMGATYQEVFARREAKKSKPVLSSTHLICPNTHNDKYRAACKWGKIAVTADWLLDSYLQKRRVNEAQYNPELAADSDSQSQNSYIMPQTPKVDNHKSSKHAGRTSTLGVTASSAAKAPVVLKNVQNEATTPSGDKSPFKTPTSVAKKALGKTPSHVLNLSAAERKLLQDPAYLEFVQKKGYNDEDEADAALAKLNSSSSFLAFRAEQRVLQGLPAEEQPSIEIEGMTTEEARNFRIALEVAGANTPPPNLNKRTIKLPTPISVTMKRSWKQLMEKFPVDKVKFPVTSTPKGRKSSASSVASVNSENNNPQRIQGVKRSSDSSLEDEVVATGGKRAEIKRLRISSESEDTDISEIHYDQEQDPECEPIQNVNNSVNNQISEDEASNLPNLPFAGLLLWISKDCYTHDLKLSIEQCGGEVVNDFNAVSVTHVIAEIETPAVAEAQERNRNLKVVKPSWVTACIDEGLKVDENEYKSIPSSKRSAKELAELLRMDDDDRCVMPVQKQKKNRNNYSTSIGNSDENQAAAAMNRDEYDAPDVVWDNDDKSKQVAGRRNRLNLSPSPDTHAQEQVENLPSTAYASSLQSSRSKQKSRSTDKSNDDQPIERERKSSTSDKGKSSSKSSSVARSLGNERAESEDSPKSYPVPSRPKFILSGLTEQDKSIVEKSIKKLKGEILDSSTFTPEVDILITQRLARSEKVLASIASGKFVLKASYLEHCMNKGRFLPVTEDFLWKYGEGKDPLEDEVARSAYYWFLKTRQNPPVMPFQDYRVFLYDKNDSKSAAYERLIAAGGGSIVLDIRHATMIIRNKGNPTQSDPIPIPAGIRVESPLILSSTIIIKPN